MSARRYQILSLIFSVLAHLASLALFGYLIFAMLFLNVHGQIVYGIMLGAALLCYALLPLHIVVHELGHCLFGLCAGMCFVAVSVGHVTFFRGGVRVTLRNRGAGETQFYPAGPRAVRGRTIATALGGAVCNFLYVIAVVAAYFALPHTPAVFFFALFAPLQLAEVVLALLPAHLPAGDTDGETIVSLCKRSPEALALVHVLTAQGMLRKGSYASLPRELLFDLPPVPDDAAALPPLLQLRWQYALFTGTEGAEGALDRLEALYPCLGGEEAGEIAGDLAYRYLVLSPDEERAQAYLDETADDHFVLSLFKETGYESPLCGLNEFARFALEKAQKNPSL